MAPLLLRAAAKLPLANRKVFATIINNRKKRKQIFFLAFIDLQSWLFHYIMSVSQSAFHRVIEPNPAQQMNGIFEKSVNMFTKTCLAPLISLLNGTGTAGVNQIRTIQQKIIIPNLLQLVWWKWPPTDESMWHIPTKTWFLCQTCNLNDQWNAAKQVKLFLN